MSAAVIGAVAMAARTSPKPGADLGIRDLELDHWNRWKPLESEPILTHENVKRKDLDHVWYLLSFVNWLAAEILAIPELLEHKAKRN